jgi:hypothetical protein
VIYRLICRNSAETTKTVDRQSIIESRSKTPTSLAIPTTPTPSSHAIHSS